MLHQLPFLTGLSDFHSEKLHMVVLLSKFYIVSILIHQEVNLLVEIDLFQLFRVTDISLKLLEQFGVVDSLIGLLEYIFIALCASGFFKLSARLQGLNNL